MKIWKAWVLLCLWWPVQGMPQSAGPQSAEPVWKVNITTKYGFQAFDRTINFRWTLHQGVAFISPDRVLIYQVNRSRGPAKLSARDASGGSGNFVLQIKVLSTKDGSEIKSLELPTNAEFSKVLATRDGKFIARTGDVLYLYSATFEKLASHPLPMKREAPEEAWQIGVSPAGDEVVLVHQQVFHRSALSPSSAIEKAASDIEVLNADNLQTLRTFSLPSVWSYWNAAEHYLMTSTPQPSVSAPNLFGVLNIDGTWSPLLPEWYSAKQTCPYQVQALDHDLFAAFGCGHFSVFPRGATEIFSLKKKGDDFVSTVAGAGNFYAVQVEHRTIRYESSGNVPIVTSQPLHIDVYPAKGTVPLLSAPVHTRNIYFTVSPRGTLVVGDGTSLALYAAKP
jgi:hypothetical protein